MVLDLSQFFDHYSGCGENDESDKRKQLLAVKDRLLYTWTKDGLRAAVGLKSSTSEQGNVSQKKCIFEFEVKLVLTKKPDGDIEWIELNQSGSCLAICSLRRVYVVFLPRSLWLLRSLNEVEKEYLCRCISVDDWIAKKNKSLRCLRVRWHPGSSIDRHLVTLWSDDTFRIYNVSQVADPPYQISLDASPIGKSTSKTSLIRSSLGESAVSFDFGSALAIGEISDAEVWPIFVLCGNGDVYSIIHDVKRQKHASPVGPLVISPASDNNYGADACDIAFLHGNLPILVIGTTYGILYHALVIRDEKKSAGTDIVFVLHIYESVELEFSLSTVDMASAEVKEDNETSNLAIIKDPLFSRRYYACHRAGLHMVELSWVHDLEEENSSVLSDAASNVEYALCSAPKLSAGRSESCPIGLALITSLSSDSVLVALLSDFSICCLPANYDAVRPITFNEKTDDANVKKTAHNGYFVDSVKRALQKSATVPVLRARTDKQISEQEAAELMCRCLEVLRKEYGDRLLAARELCDKRVLELGEIFVQQNQDLLRLAQLTKATSDRARHSRQRREELAERQQALLERLERVTEHMAGGETRGLSVQEENMYKELNEMKDNVATTVDEVAELKARLESFAVGTQSDRSTLATPTRMHEMSVKKRLEEQQLQIESLMRSVKALRNIIL